MRQEMVRQANWVMLVAACSLCMTGCPPESRHQISVWREFVTPEEEALIALAESVCPPREDVLAVFSGQPPKPSDECLWWYEEWEDGFRLPYAITADAIDFYSDQILQWQNGPGPLSSSFRYTAKVEYGWTYEDKGGQLTDAVAVVMQMEWSMTCGRLCGNFFEKNRVVLFAPDGTPLAVFGDGPVLLMVS